MTEYKDVSDDLKNKWIEIQSFQLIRRDLLQKSFDIKKELKRIDRELLFHFDEYERLRNLLQETTND